MASSRDGPNTSIDNVKGNSPESPNGSQTEFTCTPHEYAKRVYNFSKLKTGRGHNFHNIAKFLDPRYSNNPNLPDDFVTVYQLSLQRPSTTCHHVRTPEEFEQLELQDGKSDSNHIVFLRGYLSAEWLRLIGAQYEIDPEFFRRHYNFESLLRPTTLNFTSLPSSSLRMFELILTTVQTNVHSSSRFWSDLRQRRNAKKSAMESYTRDLVVGNIAPGDPVVRNYTMIDASLFAIEQKISVYLHEDKEKWTLFVCVDGNKDLSLTSRGPWLHSTTSNPKSRGLFTEPIINYKPFLALKSHLMRNDISDQSHVTPGQSASSLHHDYGQSLQADIMARDAVYALKEIFELVTHAELQFLSHCDERLTDLQQSQFSNDAEFLPNLKNMQSLLYRHLQQNRNALQSLEIPTRQRWPRSYKDGYGDLRALRQDFKRLSELNDHLHNRCVEAIGLLTNEMVIAESTKARDQATRIGKLTFLAFIFVPLSFTTSFFGMNLKELGADVGALSIWVWFVVSMPLLTLAILFFIYDLSQLRQFCVHFVKSIYHFCSKGRSASPKSPVVQSP